VRIAKELCKRQEVLKLLEILPTSDQGQHSLNALVRVQTRYHADPELDRATPPNLRNEDGTVGDSVHCGVRTIACIARRNEPSPKENDKLRTGRRSASAPASTVRRDGVTLPTV
jgi:hypothetical protein